MASPLPHFQPAWEDRQASSECFGRRLYVGRLRACKQRFHKHFARAAGLLDETPLCAQDKYDILLLRPRRHGATRFRFHSVTSTMWASTATLLPKATTMACDGEGYAP